MAIADHPLAMRAGDVLWNPLTGEKSLVVESATETGGARIVVDLAVEAGGFVPGGEHVHDHCAEHLEVRAGEIACVLDGVERVLGPGDGLTNGRTDAQGHPSPLLGALLATSFRRELRFRRPPAVVQRFVFAALARRRGLEHTLERYLDPATHPSARRALGHLPERVRRPASPTEEGAR